MFNSVTLDKYYSSYQLNKVSDIHSAREKYTFWCIFQLISEFYDSIII